MGGSLKGRDVNERHVIVPAAGHREGYTGNEIGTLVSLIVPVRGAERCRCRVDSSSPSKLMRLTCDRFPCPKTPHPPTILPKMSELL